MKKIITSLAATISLTAALLGVSQSSAIANSAVAKIDTTSRSAVAASYNEHIVEASKIEPNWTGNSSRCSAGSASHSYDQATLDSINWFRQMAGLSNVVEHPTYSADAQAAALIMHAQNTLSHYPQSNWACYTAAGADAAATSNLTLAIAGTRGVLGQIEDPGATNDKLGHRRWLLFPELTQVGIGNTDYAGVVKVIGNFGARTASKDWIAWPPSGFVPQDVVFPRWSLSYNDPNTDISGATVSMTENGKTINVKMLPSPNGFGDPTLGWEPIGISPKQNGDVTYKVTVSNILVGGSRLSHSYTVTSFDPNSSNSSTAPADTRHTCQGRLATIVGTNGNDVIHGTNGIDVIVGLNGNDKIYGKDGNDIICGGKGDDFLSGDAHGDTLVGGPGKDTMRGGGGHDKLYGNGGRDRLFGNKGNDTLIGGGKGDRFVGHSGRDTCWGEAPSQNSSYEEQIRQCESGGK